MKRLAFKRETEFVTRLVLQVLKWFCPFAKKFSGLKLRQRFFQRLFEGMKLIVEISLMMLALATLLDRIFKNVTDGENWIGNSLEIYFSHFNLKNLNLCNLFRNFSIIFLILLYDRSINLVFSLENSLNILLNILNDALYFCLKINNCLINHSYWSFNLNSLTKNIIVTFVFLKLKWFVHKLKILIDILDLLSIKFLRSDEILFNFFFFVLDLV